MTDSSHSISRGKKWTGDYLSRHSSKEATPIITYDNMFTVPKINLIRTALGFDKISASRGSNTCNNKFKAPHIKAESKQSINRLKVSSRDKPGEGGKSCERQSTNQKRTHGLSRRLPNFCSYLVDAITQSKKSCLNLSNSKFHNSKSQIAMNNNMKKWQKFLKQHPSLNNSSDKTEELPLNNLSLEAITKETRSVRTSTTLSLPAAIKGETITSLDPNSVCMSIIPRNCEIVSKITALPDLFNLKFLESITFLTPN